MQEFLNNIIPNVMAKLPDFYATIGDTLLMVVWSGAISFVLGLTLGLKMPNLSWTNEVVPIKQSACVALSLFGGWAVAMIPGALYLLTGIGSLDPLLYLSVVTALLLILSAVLSLWVKRTGSRIFAAL